MQSIFFFRSKLTLVTQSYSITTYLNRCLKGIMGGRLYDDRGPILREPIDNGHCALGLGHNLPSSHVLGLRRASSRVWTELRGAIRSIGRSSRNGKHVSSVS